MKYVLIHEPAYSMCIISFSKCYILVNGAFTKNKSGFTKLLLLLLVLLCLTRAMTQPYYFRHYQVENGLSNNTVYCSLQDKAGFLWFGTKDGLNRFDGYHFKQFNTSAGGHSLTPDAVYALFSDARGVLWAGLQKGLYRFDAETEQLLPFIDSVRDVSAIHTDGKGRLWFIAQAVLYRYDFDIKRLKRFAPKAYFRPSAICETPDGVLWFATRDGLLKKFDPATETFATYNMFAHSPAAASRYIQKLCPAGTDFILVGTSDQGLKLFQISIAGYKDVLTYNADKTTVYVRDIVPYAPNEYWLATESGIYIWAFEKGVFTNLKKKALDPYSLSDNAIYTLCKDGEGGIWAGTYFGGVNYYPKQYNPFQKYFPDYTKNSISGNVVREICEDGYGNLWIGTEDAGLNKLSKKTGVVNRFSPTGARSSIAYSNIHGLLVDGNDLWIGTFEHGLDVMDVRTGRVRKHYAADTGATSLKSNFIISLLKTAAGEIFIGTSNGVVQYNRKKNDFTQVNTGTGSFFSALLEDHNKTIWMATHDRGVFYYNPATNQQGHFENNPDDQTTLPTNTINAICEDSRHNLWFATEGGGLCGLSPDRKRFTRYTTRNGLPGNFVFKVLEDADGKLWATTSKGLARLNPADNTITVYTKENGLLNNQFNYNSGYKDADGKLYFGSVKGMITFTPASFSGNRFDPPVYITGIQVHGNELNATDHGLLKKSVLHTDKLTLPYNQSSISIDVAALTYTSPETTVYSYKMKGLDNERTFMTTNRKIYFTNLAPGAYTFNIKAGANGNWSEKSRSLAIIILPPFWATGWAYAFYALVAILLFYYLVRSYHIRIDDKKEKEIYEAKLDFFTNITHEIRTPLTLIKGPLENLQELTDIVPEIQEDVQTMERATDRLIALITQILDFRKTETKSFSLDLSKVNITKLLQEEHAAFTQLAKKRRLAYGLDLPVTPVYAVADEEALQKVFSNLLSNAVKYAARNITVRLHPVKKEDAVFTIEFSNDGNLIPAEIRERIFEPFYRWKGAARQKGAGIGLTLARSLAGLHKGNLYLKDSRNGTNTFVLQLPLQPEPPYVEDASKTSTFFKTP